ncbi:MAG: glutathione synthase [Candidatus Dadabacteria bacterium]|nr:glutathione synthase [Candidatus Dadabacteria bacterium]NIS09210.1 glutathione synthase [Candidatus Dadabacteria bacterium]NIV43194.1 glutathione synthase [Candidatus Dadabacteria bacterium]NIY22260.1 glutathione synthase [Candidatus Dadabacteria bacterium]
MKLRMGFIVDPIENFNINTDTTFTFMLESQARGYDVWYFEIKDIFVKDGRPFCNAKKVKVKRARNHYKVTSTRTLSFEDFDVLWMRKDPPFNMDYVYTTYYLSLVDPKKTFVINDPKGIRESNEKLYTMYFPDVIPQSCVAKDIGRLNEFLDEVGGQMVVKPLDGHGGEGVFFVKKGDKNADVIIENITNFGTQFVLAQKFIKKVSEGDKRIIILNGKPIGSVLRVAKKGGEFRCNFHSGGSAKKSTLTKRDRYICDAISERLVADGLYFVGIDVIGGYLSEVNTTSPTCVQEINALSKVKLEEQVIDFVEDYLNTNNIS